MTVTILVEQQKIRAFSPVYAWEWDGSTDLFTLRDSEKRLIGQGHHQPFVVTEDKGRSPAAERHSFEIEGDRVLIHYSGVNGASQLTVGWTFKSDVISLDPLRYESAREEKIVEVVYFPMLDAGSYTPSFYSRYAVVPGLCMSPNVSPVVDLHSRLSVTAVLGSGAMRGPGLTQQWGLPAHYFCVFNTADRWNAIGAGHLQSNAACWGLADIPRGDFRLDIREIGISPVLNVRSDLWGHLKTPGTLQLGCAFVITFGSNYYEAIRAYYKTLLRENIIASNPASISQKKREVMLSPQYNTWGVESAKALPPDELTEDMIFDMVKKLKRSGMKARTFVIDDKWEVRYGALEHDQVRFPHFDALLDTIRADGYAIGLWAAFLRCQDPSAVGLSESHLLKTPEGTPLWLSHHTSRYGIFDVTQPIVQQVLRERARQFVRRYKPDLIKFDFGYELPSLDAAAPADMDWAGERLLQKGLQVVVGAMKEENPDLVIMYYGLSPLLLDYYDLHSPDDLVYCGGDYDLETNRRIFFSSLCGELGMPTYGSSGYDWESALDIWFDSAPSGTLGSLHCFDGDEHGDLPQKEWIAKYNGLSAILRQQIHFQINPVDAQWQGGLRAAFSPSWERVEQDKTVLLALRTHRFDGKPARKSYKDILHTDVMLVVASLTGAGISETHRLGLVPFGEGRCSIRRSAASGTVRAIEHYFSGHNREERIEAGSDRIELNLQESRNDEILEWLELIFVDNVDGVENFPTSTLPTHP